MLVKLCLQIGQNFDLAVAWSANTGDTVLEEALELLALDTENRIHKSLAEFGRQLIEEGTAPEREFRCEAL